MTDHSKKFFFSNILQLYELNIGKKLKYFDENFRKSNESFFEDSGGNLFQNEKKY